MEKYNKTGRFPKVLQGELNEANSKVWSKDLIVDTIGRNRGSVIEVELCYFNEEEIYLDSQASCRVLLTIQEEDEVYKEEFHIVSRITFIRQHDQNYIKR